MNIRTVVDGKYRIDGVCSDAGGMGTVLFVTPVSVAIGFPVVLKFCKNQSAEELARFRREVRLLYSFRGNSKVVDVVDVGLESDPPYFVMRHYPDGDLFRNTPQIQADPTLQERLFLQMIDCIQELHSRGVFHRDIKPQNFLISGGNLVVSDFGLSTEVGSSTGFTRSSVYWGTQGYIPPEFLAGGFRHAAPPSDIFMLGKTMYSLLSNRSPMYPIPDGIAPQLFYIVERCCQVQPERRYQSLAELRQAIVSAFDVLFGRADGVGRAKQLLSQISDALAREGRCNPTDLASFIALLSSLDAADKVRLSYEIPRQLFTLLANSDMAGEIPSLLTAYSSLVESKDYGWSYAETIAENMREIFAGMASSIVDKGIALDLALRAAIYMNRFAAMDTCREMITHVADEGLGFRVAGVLLPYDEYFLRTIEPSECRSNSVADAIRQIRAREI